MAGCNWELFELRVTIYHRGEKNKTTGNFSGEEFWEFFNVSVDLRSLGIANFQGSNNSCNFTTIFRQLIKLQVIPFSFAKERIRSDRFNFSNLQAAERNKISFRAAKLYVHRRDQSDHSSDTTGVGVLLEGVSVLFTAKDDFGFYVSLSGDSANAVNF